MNSAAEAGQGSDRAPRVSVIMTVYNGEAYLAESLDCLLGQTLADLEVVVNDNGSTDGTGAILAGIADPRLRVVRAPSPDQATFAHGIARAFAQARGTYVAVQDADDVSLPTRLEKQADFLDNHPRVALVAGWAEWFGAGMDPQLQAPPAEPEALRDCYPLCNPVVHSSIMLRRQAATAVGGYDTRFTISCDFAMALALMEAGHQVAAIPELLVRMRRHPQQTSWRPEQAVARTGQNLELLRRAQLLPGLPDGVRRRGRREIAKATLNYAVALWNAGRRAEAVRALAGVMAQQPLFTAAYSAFRTGRAIRHSVLTAVNK